MITFVQHNKDGTEFTNSIIKDGHVIHFLTLGEHMTNLPENHSVIGEEQIKKVVKEATLSVFKKKFDEVIIETAVKIGKTQEAMAQSIGLATKNIWKFSKVIKGLDLKSLSEQSFLKEKKPKRKPAWYTNKLVSPTDLLSQICFAVDGMPHSEVQILEGYKNGNKEFSENEMIINGYIFPAGTLVKYSYDTMVYNFIGPDLFKKVGEGVAYGPVFSGHIHDVKLHDHVLSPEDISKLPQPLITENVIVTSLKKEDLLLAKKELQYLYETNKEGPDPIIGVDLGSEEKVVLQVQDEKGNITTHPVKLDEEGVYKGVVEFPESGFTLKMKLKSVDEALASLSSALVKAEDQDKPSSETVMGKTFVVPPIEPGSEALQHPSFFAGKMEEDPGIDPSVKSWKAWDPYKEPKYFD